MRVLVTGGAGFIGSNLVRFLIENTDWEVIVLDKLTYAGNLENLRGLEENPRFKFVRGDIVDRKVVDECMKGVEIVFHLAAESHVDRSILKPQDFIVTNVFGTHVLLESALIHRPRLFINVSTDEVYGSIENGSFKEDSPLSPSSPYSASKASQDLLGQAYFKTYSLPVITTRCSNNYGEYQFPEKLIPLTITNLLEGKPVPVYGKGENIRDWIHVRDHVKALYLISQRGKPGEIYNIAGKCERRNIDVVKKILKILGKDESFIKFVKDRPGHDFRYSMDTSKIEREIGWEPEIDFDRGLEMTVQWFIENRGWWERIKSGEYMKFYEEWYGSRL
jgi:dTDP-glucose 4,6-dehydratase